MREFTVGIGGAAGDGQASTGDVLARLVARAGLHLYASSSYQSVIRGGHTWLSMRIADAPVGSVGDRLDAILALNAETVEFHARDLSAGGAILHAQGRVAVDPARLPAGARAIALPVREILAPLGDVLPVMQNTVLLGGLVALLGRPLESLEAVLGTMFGKKSAELVRQNVEAARGGFRAAAAALGPGWMGPGLSGDGVRRAVLTGNEAMALGAVAAGCRFYCAYPMTPASSILHWMAARGSRLGIEVRQTEDEIAAMNMCVGAGIIGVRAMCGTSGGGFALMTEAVSEAGMLEAPVVIVEAQRAGPSTGLPTKTEQSDLRLVLGAGQGDYPRAIFAPTDLLDAFATMEEAFNVAERFQMPVIVMSDLLLSEHHETADPAAFRFAFRIDRGEIAEEFNPAAGPYLRFRDTPTGVSPRALPGTKGCEHLASTDEHDERGVNVANVLTHPPTRKRMMDKRMRKVETLATGIPAPALLGDPDASVVLAGFGSTKGAMLEAAAILSAAGTRVAILPIRNIHPFPAEAVRRALAGRDVLVVENNATAQFARHMRAEAGVEASGHVLKYDGEPFAPGQIAEAVRAFEKEKRPKGFRFACLTPAETPKALQA